MSYHKLRKPKYEAAGPKNEAAVPNLKDRNLSTRRPDLRTRRPFQTRTQTKVDSVSVQQNFIIVAKLAIA